MSGPTNWELISIRGHGIIAGISEVVTMIGEIATIVGFVSLIVSKIVLFFLSNASQLSGVTRLENIKIDGIDMIEFDI